MPRYGFKESKYSLLYDSIGYFKIEYEDYIYDFKHIYKDLSEFFSDTAYEKHFKDKYAILSKVNIKPTLSNRMYIITNFDRPVFTMVNMDESVIDHLIDTYKFLTFMSENIPQKVFASYISSLYIFKNDKMCLKERISPCKVAELVSVFKKENLVNYEGARDDYYAKPRREYKKSQSK